MRRRRRRPLASPDTVCLSCSPSAERERTVAIPLAEKRVKTKNKKKKLHTPNHAHAYIRHHAFDGCFWTSHIPPGGARTACKRRGSGERHTKKTKPCAFAHVRVSGEELLFFSLFISTQKKCPVLLSLPLSLLGSVNNSSSPTRGLAAKLFFHIQKKITNKIPFLWFSLNANIFY